MKCIIYFIFLNKYLLSAHFLHSFAPVSEDALTDKTDTYPCVPVKLILYC